MTKEEALHLFFSSFGLSAWEESAVPDGSDAPEFPYITYSVVTDDFGSQIPLYMNLWYRDTSWTSVNEKSRQIEESIGRGGVMLSCEGGAVWLKRGQPFSQSLGDPEDDMIRRKYINITAEFIT